MEESTTEATSSRAATKAKPTTETRRHSGAITKEKSKPTTLRYARGQASTRRHGESQEPVSPRRRGGAEKPPRRSGRSRRKTRSTSRPLAGNEKFAKKNKISKHIVVRREHKGKPKATTEVKCGNCQNTGFHRLLHIRKWFTLFFVPVIPYESHHYPLCDVCSRGFELNGPQIEKARRMNQATTAYLGKQTTEEQYKMALSESRLLE